MILTLVVLLSTIIINVNAHGYLWVPVSRSSAWRTDNRFPPWYDDMSLYCGDSAIMMNAQNQGRCGICGEVWSEKKRLEKGGDLYRGYIVKTYKNTDTIDVTYQLTANHLGAFEFYLCNVDNMPNGEATQECLDKLILEDVNGNTLIKNPNESDNAQGPVSFKLRIPAGFRCNHCVFQAKWYTTHQCGGSMSWNTFINCPFRTKQTFVGCSDITITGSDGDLPFVPRPPTEAQAVVTTQAPSGPLVAAWGQCGGNNYIGSTNCAPGSTCVMNNEWYSQCIPNGK